jgi:hypothetical protein
MIASLDVGESNSMSHPAAKGFHFIAIILGKRGLLALSYII